MALQMKGEKHAFGRPLDPSAYENERWGVCEEMILPVQSVPMDQVVKILICRGDIQDSPSPLP